MKGAPSFLPLLLALSSKELQLKDSSANVPLGSIHVSPIFSRLSSPSFSSSSLSLSLPFETADACIMGPDRGGRVSVGLAGRLSPI